MVFASVVTDVMNRFLGDFIEDLDSKQLNLGIWGGDVVLRNVKLKQDALKELDLPIQTVYGHLGTLVLKIPWKNLYSQPVVVTIEDLYLLAAPNTDVRFNADKQAAADLASKREEVQKLDEIRKRELSTRSGAAPATPTDKSFTEKLVAQIINNVQVKITNVHVRYEDRVSSPVSFALGVTLGSLELHTTDADWNATFLSEALSKVFKVAKLDGLAVYMNCNTTMVQSMAVDRFNEIFLQTIARQDQRPVGFSYVLGPINALAKLKLNMNPELDVPAFQTPKIDLFLEMQTLAVGLTREQYQQLVAVADGFGYMTRGLPYRKFRPYKTPVKGNAKLWWKFAYTAIVETDIRRRKREWSWDHMRRHLDKCRLYAAVYEKRLVSRKEDKPTNATCDQIECEMSLFCVKLIRQRVEFEVDRSGVLERPPSPAAGWLSGWFSSGQKSGGNAAKGTSEDIKKQLKSAMTPEEKAKLFSAIGYSESDSVSVLPIEYVALQANFQLNMLEVVIRNEKTSKSSSGKEAVQSTTVLSFQVKDVKCSIDQRPAASGLEIDLRLREFNILGLERADFVPTIVKSRLDCDRSLLEVNVQLNPLDGKCDQRVRVSARPVEIVYDALTLIELVKIFTPPKDTYLVELGDAASVELSNIKERSATGIQFMVDKRSRLDVHMDIMPNCLVIPYGGVYVGDKTASAMVLCLGQLTLRTAEHRDRRDVAALYAAGLTAEQVMHEVRNQAYDKFVLEVQNVQVLLATAGENWKAYLNQEHVTQMHIIEPIRLSVQADMCMVGDDPQLPRTRITTKIPRIGVSIADDRVLCAIALLTSIPLPNDDELQPRPLTKDKSTGFMQASSVSLKRLFNETTPKSRSHPSRTGVPATGSGSGSDPTPDELVQFTDLEFTFVMHELCINLYRAQDADLSPTTHSFRTPPEELSIAEQDVLGTPLPPRPSLASVDGSTGRHISVRVRQLEMAMVQRTYDMRVSLKLGAVSVNQLRPDDLVLRDLAIIETPTFAEKSGYLFACTYTNVNRTSPEFATRHKSVEQLIDVHFTVLIMRLHQERLSEIMRLLYDMQSQIDGIMRRPSAKFPVDAMSPVASNTPSSGGQQRDRFAYAGDSMAQAALTTIAEEMGAGLAATVSATGARRQTPVGRPRQRQAKVVDSIQLKVLANVERVAIVLESDRKRIAELKIEKLTAAVVMKKSYTDVVLKLQDIVVTDPNPRSIHNTIMTVVGNNALNCQLVMYDLNETANYNSDNMKIDVKMGCVRIVFLNWFLSSVLNFLDHFQEAQRAIFEASAAAAEQAKQNVVQAYENAQRMRLNIQIKAPIILVPIDSRSLEAIAIDFGYLAISNVCTEIPNSAQSDHGAAILDEMKLELKALKLSRVHIQLNESSSSSLVNRDDHEERRLSAESSSDDILSPTTFALLIRRNLSAGWYRQIPDLDVSGRLKSIVMNMMHNDAQLVLSILARNLAEGADERYVAEPLKPVVRMSEMRSRTGEEAGTDSAAATASTAAAEDVQVHTTTAEVNRPEATENEQQNEESIAVFRQTIIAAHTQLPEVLPLAGPKTVTDTFLKFTFQMDSIVVNLFTAKDVGLASFGIYHFSLKGYQLVDQSLFASIVLCDMQLDDCRPNREHMITKFMNKKAATPVVSSSQSLRRSQSPATDEPETTMLDVVVRITKKEMFVNLLVSSFDLILSLEFLMQLLGFLKLPETIEPPDGSPTAGSSPNNGPDIVHSQHSARPGRSSSVGQVDAAANKKITLIMKIEQPDIILVEQMDNINCLALILNTQVELRVRSHMERMIFAGEIADLNMFVCEFNPVRRSQTKHYVLHPCNLTLHATTPQVKGIHISLTASDIRLNITPGTIDLLNKALATFSVQSTAGAALQAAETDYSNMWHPKQFVEHDHWYMKVDDADDALSMVSYEPDPLPEVCIVEMPTIVIVVETGFGYYTYPMLHLISRMNAEIRDWSSDMSISSSLSLGMSYYNSTLAVWEPIIEPNERLMSNGLVEYVPWELSFNLNIDKNPADDSIAQETEAKTKIIVASSETLELTVTKSCLDVLKDLGVAFSSALSQEGLQHPENVAPFVVVNDTGFDVTLALADSPMLHLHQASSASIAVGTSSDAGSVLLAPGDRAMLQADYVGQSMKSLTQTTQSQEMFLSVRIGQIAKEIRLPIHKADRRYFPLYRDTKQEPWGVISQVRTEYGSTMITLHGVVQIENHFSIAIEVFRVRSARDGKLHSVGRIEPGQTFNVPLHALYAERKELFFSLAGYHTSVQGINWTVRPTDYKYTKLLQCDPQHTFEPFYMMAIRERHEIYHEITSKHTMLSAYYVIHLHPPLYVRNALPIDLFVSVAGCSVAQLIESATEANDDGSTVISRNSATPSILSTSLGDGHGHTSRRGEKQQIDFLDYGEKVVRPGDILHLPTVKTTVKEGENRSYIVARIVQYLDRDWSCTTEIPSNPDEFAVWVFNSYDSVGKMTLELGVKFDMSAGNMQLIVYCPYWMINKTGLMLSYRSSDENVNVLFHPPTHDGPILFSFREKHFFGKKQAALRVESGAWSDKFALDAAGSTGKVECKHDRMTYQIAVNSTLTSNSLTKQIVFTPFYVLINKAPFAVEVQEDQRPADPWQRIEPNDCVALWPRVTNEPMLRAKTPDSAQDSVPFRYVSAQTSLLKLANRYGGINVDVQTTEGGTYIVFSEYHAGDAPALLVNHTGREVLFWERGNVNPRRIAPYHQLMYTWSDPAGPRRIYWNEHDKSAESDLCRDGLNEYRRSSLAVDHTDDDGADGSLLSSLRASIRSSGSVSQPAFWVSFLDGTQRVLLFTDNFAIAEGANSASRLDHVSQEIEVEIHGVGVSLVNNVKQVDIMYIGMASSNVMWEEKKRSKFFKALSIQEIADLEDAYQEYLRQRQVGDELGTEFGLRDGSRVEITEENGVLWHRANGVRPIRRLFYPGLWVNIKSSPYQLQLHAKINRIQIDNQLVDYIFPVVLAPVPPPKSVAGTTELKPFIECSIVQRVIPYSSVKQFKYMTVLIQEFHVKVDLLFINEIVDMISSDMTEEDALKLFHDDLDRQREQLSALALSHSSQEQKNFYDQLHLGPLKIHISFSMAGLETTALPGVLATILQGVGVTLTDVNDIVFRLAFFERNYQFFTQSQLTAEVTTHYAGLALKQAYVLILGLDVIGNPYGLVIGFTKGVEDLFYEPFQGAIQGPGEFAEGLVLGVRSLFGHTVGGAAGAVSKITGAMGKGLAALTFDKAYQTKRRKQLNRKPANLQEGLARSGKGLVMGVYDGVTGVFTKPISGAKSEGVEGFFKGLGKGAVGLVARPTAGLVDFASGSFDAVKRATELSNEVTRLRARRLMHADGIVRPFSRREADGNRLLKDVDKGRYANSDTFVDFQVVQPKRQHLLITDQRVLFCVKNDLFGGWQTEWTHRWPEIVHVRSVEKGIELLLGEKNRKVLGLFGSNQQQKKLVIMERCIRQQMLVDAMLSQVRIAQQDIVIVDH